MQVAILLGSSFAIEQLARADDYATLDLERLFSSNNQHLNAELRDFYGDTNDVDDSLVNDTVIPLEELLDYEELPTPLPGRGGSVDGGAEARNYVAYIPVPINDEDESVSGSENDEEYYDYDDEEYYEVTIITF